MSSRRQKISSKFACVSLVTLALILVGMLSVSCTITSPIVGKWREANGDTTEFTWNGRVIIDTGRTIITGTYEIVGDGYVKVQLEGLAGAFTSLFGADTMKFKVSSDGSILELAQGGRTTMLRRVISPPK